MDYGQIMSRALAITWRHKYLWLLALFAGEGAASFTYSFGFPSTGSNNGTSPRPAQVWSEVSIWLEAHVWLLVAVGLAILAVGIAFFLLSAIVDGGLVRASSEHDAGRPFRLGQAWSAGLTTFWMVLKVKLLTLLVELIALVVIGGVSALAVLQIMSGVATSGAILVGVAALLFLAYIPFSIVFSVVVLLMVRDVVLTGRSTLAAVTHSFGLMRRRLGRVAVLWLLSAALSIAASIAMFVVGIVLLGIAAIPVVAMAVTRGSTAAIVTGIVVGALWLAVLYVISAAILAFTSTYWTLGYTRLDFELLRPALNWPTGAA